MKINVGCGYNYLPGYVNVDASKNSLADKVMPAECMGFPEKSVDVVQAFQLIEHLGYFKTLFFLRECYRLLRKDGLLVVETPDIEESFRIFLRGGEREREKVLGWIYGSESRGMNHVYCFPGELLEKKAVAAGFDIVEREKKFFQESRPSLSYIFRKRNNESKEKIAVFSHYLIEKGSVDFSDENISFENEKTINELEKFIGENETDFILALAVFNPEMISHFFEFSGETALVNIIQDLLKSDFVSGLYGKLTEFSAGGCCFTESFGKTARWGKDIVFRAKSGEIGRFTGKFAEGYKIFSKRMALIYSQKMLAEGIKEKYMGNIQKAAALIKKSFLLCRDNKMAKNALTSFEFSRKKP